MASKKKTHGKDAGQSTPKYRTAQQELDDRRKAAARKKRAAGTGGVREHNAPELNRGRDARFVGWAMRNPVAACKQAQALFDEKGETWQLELVRKHRIGGYVDRRPQPQTPAKPATPKRLPVSPGKMASLETEAGAARTRLTTAEARFKTAEFDRKLADAGVPVSKVGRRGHVPPAQVRRQFDSASAELEAAKTGLAEVEKALNDAIVANEAALAA